MTLRKYLTNALSIVFVLFLVHESSLGVLKYSGAQSLAPALGTAVVVFSLLGLIVFVDTILSDWKPRRRSDPNSRMRTETQAAGGKVRGRTRKE